tara:strand:- start:160 stop:693 length:534 start_codon:yes stop_codon:yes gene_type:complete
MPKNYNDCIEITTYCGSGLCAIIVCSSVIAYVISGIVFLVKDYNIWKECDGSNLWPFVLVSLIFTVNKLNLINYIKMVEDINTPNNNNTIGLLISITLTEICICIWGGIEIFDKSSNCEIQYSNIWYHGIITFSIQIFTIVLWCLILYILFVDKSKNERIKRRNASYIMGESHISTI